MDSSVPPNHTSVDPPAPEGFDPAGVRTLSALSLNRRAASVVLVLLLCGDAVFLAGHLVNELTPLFFNRPPTHLINFHLLLNLETDRGYSEIYQYLKFMWVALLLVSLTRENKVWHYLSWTLFFTYLLLDDSVQIHEKLGLQLAQLFGFRSFFGLRPRDFGEVMMSATAGVFLLFLIALAYRQGSMAFKKVSRDLALLAAGLVFFGVGVDVVHAALQVGPSLEFAFATVEESGEMVMATMLVWYVVHTKLRGVSAGPYLSDMLLSLPARRITASA